MMDRWAGAVDRDTLRGALLSPRKVALVGASADPAKTTARPLRYLRRHGFSGEILLVNPGRPEIEGMPTVPSILDLPDGVEHAFLMVRADAVADAVVACGAKGIPVATILSDGFAEAGEEGMARQQRVAESARSAGVRLLGPNSIGVIGTGRPGEGAFAMSANAALEAESLLRGRLGVVSQSGSIIGAMISQGASRGIGFSSLVSVGNEIDLSVGAIGALMLDDPRTEAILLFLESIRDGASLAQLAQAADTRGKPVIAYKLGRSEAGRALAATHTGALAGEDTLVSAFLADLGIARVRSFEALIEAPPLFIHTGAPRGRRVAVATTTGGGGAMLVDSLGTLNIEIATIPAAVRVTLDSAGIEGHGDRLVDLTLAGTRPEVVRDVISGLMADPSIDAVAIVVGSSAEFYPDLAVAPLLDFADAPKPLAIYLVPAAEASRRRLSEAGLAVFRTPEACAEGVGAYLDRRPPRPPCDTDPAGLNEIEAILAGAEGEALDEVRGRAVFAALGVPGPQGSVVTSEEECTAAVERIVKGTGAPAVLKILSAGITHKSDIGGVVLGVEDAAAARAAYWKITEAVARARPDARIDGVLVQAMASGGVAEALIGFRRDPTLGPMVVLGAGGIFTEIYRDSVVRCAPVDRDIARAMIDEVRGLRIASGYRGRAVGDMDALAEAVVAVSRLAACENVTEAEINPLLIKTVGEGVAALDALVVRREK
ncbi:acetate--CoA ligase family protein [Pararhodobacter sp. SW119]|uniref:acetate--CoA ligase family protein n=1 Tax=Pararhodobacter sp. SW119 TaxID=2780075 RepID=UPI001AE0C879|nr:acetate--CoA ligase family protein [Pararhodobacter sp. SW119]